MRACLGFLCLLAATLALSVKSKPHGKHHGLHKTSHTPKEKDFITEEANKPQVLPTLVTLETKDQEQEDEELSSEGNGNTNKEAGEFEVTEKTAVLLSEEELINLLKKEAAEEEVEEKELGGKEVEADGGKMVPGEAISQDEAKAKEEKSEDNLEMEEVVTEEGGVKEGRVEDEVEEKEEPMIKVDKMEEPFGNLRKEQLRLLEEADGSTESDIPADVVYSADSGIVQPLQVKSAKIKPHTGDTPLSKPDVSKKDVSEIELSTIHDDYQQDSQNVETAESEEVSDQDKLQADQNDKGSQVTLKETDQTVYPQETKNSSDPESGSREAGKEEEEKKNKKDGASRTKTKTRNHKKNQRAKKHSPQRQEEVSQQDPPDAERSSTDNTVHKPKRRRAGKWGPLVGMNPVQIRAAVDLYPSSRPSLTGGTHHPEAPADPCNSFRCKRGKMCKLDADKKPGCVCQEPSQCPPSVSEFDNVCGTDNKTYASSCELFATKCNLEGTKRGQKLHLDYTGPCKLIPPCVDTELVQFPLRMRDWLKNVLLQLYEHESMSPGFLTPKQRFKVKKIFEGERRLHAGDHSVELLAQDFEKNYNMYIYPVHWQFAQLDQHPSDRFLSHSELAPLRVPLVPMEHCTSRFFQECDADKDKQVSLNEWTSCFGIRDEDMNVNLLF